MSNQRSLEESIIRSLLLIVRQHRRTSRAQHENLGISGRQAAALRYLTESGAHTVSEVSDYLYISDASTSCLLDRLQDMGYVTRARSERDNRKVNVTITELGREVALKVGLGVIGRLRSGLPNLSLPELQVMDDALQKIVAIAEIQHEE